MRSWRQIRSGTTNPRGKSERHNPRVLGTTTHFLACLFSIFILRSPGRPPVGMCTSTPGRAKIAATTIITENIIRFLRESRFLEMGPGVPFSSRSPRAFGPVSARGILPTQHFPKGVCGCLKKHAESREMVFAAQKKAPLPLSHPGPRQEQCSHNRGPVGQLAGWPVG